MVGAGPVTGRLTGGHPAQTKDSLVIALDTLTAEQIFIYPRLERPPIGHGRRVGLPSQR
jgi:hypothetical protein